MKKYISVIFIIMILTLLNGCNSKETEIINDTTNTSKDLIKNTNPTKLTFFMYIDDDEFCEIKKVAEEKCGLNITLDIQYTSYSNMYSRVKSAIASNEKFDGFASSPLYNYRKLSFKELIDNGHIKDLKDLIPKYAPNIHKILQERNMLQSCYIGNTIPILPTNLATSPIKTYVKIDKKYVDKYNITDMDDLNQYIEFLKNVKNDYPNIVPGYIIAKPFPTTLIARMNDYIILEDYTHMVYKKDDPEMKLIPIEDTPEFTETLLLLNELYKNKLLTDYHTTAKYASGFKNGSCHHNGLYTRTDGAKEYRFTLYKNKPMIRKNQLERPGISFNVNSNNIELSLKFFDWIHTNKENNFLMRYGVKDIHYTYDNNIYKPLKDYLYFQDHFFSNPYYSLLYANNKDHDLDLVSKETYAPHNGFYPDYKDINAECSTRKRLFNLNFSYSNLKNGNCDIDIIKLAKQKLLASKEIVLLELQKQLDQWRLNNSNSNK